MTEALILLLTYLSGAVPFGLLFGWLSGVDVRQKGSGNIGFTNVARVCGLKWGIPVLLFDFGKGFLPVLAVKYAWFPLTVLPLPLLATLAALAAVLGHVFPVYLKFKGGKGVATSAGVLLALLPLPTGIALLVFLLTLVLSRYVSLASSLAALAVVLSHHLLNTGIYTKFLPFTLLTWLILLLVAVRHRANYLRLWQGTESKIGKK